MFAVRHFKAGDAPRRVWQLLGALGALALLLSSTNTRAQHVSAYTVKPTVTREMGDVGGKYFGKAPEASRIHHYYIAAEAERWNYMPIGSDPICGMTPPPEVRSRSEVLKVRYFQYTDGTFTQRVKQPSRLGILGPVLRGVVGDFIEITFLNRTALPLSMHPHGVKYDKDSEGSSYGDSGQLKALEAKSPDVRSTPGLGAAVAPDARFTYVWYLDEESGPLPSEPSSKAWLYHSHVGGEGEVNLGLAGFIIVTDPKRARADGTPNDVEREMPALFLIFNESQTDPEALEQLGSAGGAKSLNALLGTVSNGAQANSATDPASLKEGGERHTINGYIYGNLPGLAMNEGERVRWYLLGLGSENDLHTPHWHGLRVMEDGKRRTDTVELLPASMKVADMVADNPGDWLFHCHVADHMANGMFALVTVHPKDKPASRNLEPAFLGLPPTTGREERTNSVSTH